MENKFSKGYHAAQKKNSKPRQILNFLSAARSSRRQKQNASHFASLPSYRSTIGYYERKKNRWILPVVSAILSVVLLGLAYLLFFSPLFQLKSIQINGADRLSQDLIKQTVQEHTNKKILFYLSANNLFIFNDRALARHLNSWVDIKQAAVKKQFPNALIINVTERPYAIRWQINEKTFILDDEGIILRVLTEEEKDSFSSLPLVAGVTPRDGGVGQTLFDKNLAKGFADLAAAAYAIIGTEIIKIGFQYGDEENVVLETGEGWQAHLLFSEWPISLERLRLILIQGDLNRSQLDYIDVRYENRIFTKEKQ